MEDPASGAAAGGSILVRRARSLVVSFDGDQTIAVNYLARTSAVVDAPALALLRAADAWSDPARLLAALGPDHERARIAAALVALIDASLVVVDGTPAAELDARFERDWSWGATAGLFHFGIKDPDYQGPEAVNTWIASQVAAQGRVPLWTEHGPERLPLPPPSEDDPLLAAMRARRSYRGFARDLPVELDAIRDCLVAGLGIVGFFETATPGEGPLPLAMTPSGGARNPYEGYLLAARVSGLAAGVYHYAGIDNTLAPVGDGAPPSFASLLGDQSWFEDAAALVVLVASFPRTMWKYPHPGALRVVFVEAGHIAQNMLLCATARGLAAAPTCAIADRAVEQACRLDRATQGAVYVIGLGARGAPSIGDVREVIPNPRLGWVKGS